MNSITVVMLGAFPKTLRAACLRAAAAAGILPAAAFRIGRRNAVVVGADGSSKLYLRWRGTAKPVVTWTTIPDLLSRSWRTKSSQLVASMLADPGVLRSQVILGGKMTPVVS